MSECSVNTSEGDDSPTICLDNLDGKCKLGQRCRRLHSQTPYLWQSKLGDEWHDMPQIHIEELEKAYSTIDKDVVRLSPVDKSTSERYFPDDVACFVLLNHMTMTLGSQVFKIRRLSTVSDKQSPHKFATNYAWYFKDDNNAWTEYKESNGISSSSSKNDVPSITSESLEIAFCKGKPTLHVPSRCNEYVIDFQKMQQINQDTQETRDICRRPYGVGAHCEDQKTRPTKTQSDPVETHEWQFLEGSKWTTFELDGNRSPGDSSLSQKIEKQFQQNPTSAFDNNIGNNKYTIDFRERILTNLNTGKTMLVQRQPRKMHETEHVSNQGDLRNGEVDFNEVGSIEDWDEHSKNPASMVRIQ